MTDRHPPTFTEATLDSINAQLMTTNEHLEKIARLLEDLADALEERPGSR